MPRGKQRATPPTCGAGRRALPRVLRETNSCAAKRWKYSGEDVQAIKQRQASRRAEATKAALARSFEKAWKSEGWRQAMLKCGALGASVSRSAARWSTMRILHFRRGEQGGGGVP